ncbi:MAG: Putative K(+)-stimulated pyrophosphate-energized sodium pump [Marinimicrobia bacterium 46_47]|nr:MAG: Putative K(+)-stimulated pyrophosphate-energized sodium pump [Marinimicrobia bacterium 46_47]KUK91514.1 MAG: pyrophosphate-energized proton pump [Marinimicrobia bacterium 46_43]
MTHWILIMVPAVGALALIYALIRSGWITRQDPGEKEMVEISQHIREGAMAFLVREYRVLSLFVVVVAILLILSNSGILRLVALSFITGALASALAGFIGMRVATAANVRTTQAAKTSLAKALVIAFSGGSVMGLSVVGLGLLGLGSLFWAYVRYLGSDPVTIQQTVLPILSGFSLGASSIALFARVAGGIYTKAADVGADLVGKVEAGIPEDDPRNPAVIADNVGDNVGDVAGMGADLFESYVGSIIGAMVLGATVSVGGGFSGGFVMLPLVLSAVGILVSLVAVFLVRENEKIKPQTALNISEYGAAILMIVLSWFTITRVLPSGTFDSGRMAGLSASGVFIATLFGILAGTLIGLITEYFTAESKSPARRVANAASSGSATNIISGLSMGMRSTVLPIIVLAGTIMAAYHFAGLYGIAVAALGMLTTIGVQLSVDAFGPIADNAGGIAEMAGLKKSVRKRTDALDAVGNTTAAIGKGFAVGSAALTALALFNAYKTTAHIDQIDLTEPRIMAGLLIGGMLPFLFTSLAMQAVGDAAFSMITEVRRQFREIKGLMAGEAKADFKRCVDISTKAAIRKMVLPGLLAVGVPVLVGFYDPSMLAGVLAGTTVTGVLMAIFMANAGGVWDNAKKYIENGHLGGKGGDAHKASVVGDTVGDPFKDTAGPSLNILIKLMSVVSLVIAPIIT